MARIYHIAEEEGYNQRSYEENMLEKAFKEGCEHGYKKAMREIESFNERSPRMNYREGFEEKIEKLKEKYK